MRINKCLLLCCVICISCSRASLRQEQWEYALDFTAFNCLELKKVLHHYNHNS